jgi:uncharacterized membrane protein
LKLSENNTSANARVQSIDLLRGIIMIIMAIDHVRVFSGVMPGGPTAAIFFTRWITHFCAPAFAFYAGTSALLYLQKAGKSETIKFLITRGLLLVVLELTVVRFFWTFNFDYATFVHTNVFWMLGWCMVILAMFVRVRPLTVGLIGVAIIFGQQLFQYIPYVFPSSIQETVANYWRFFYPSELATKPTTAIIPGFVLPEVLGISVLYVIIPWIGVMMAGYGFGQLLLQEPQRVKKFALRIGIGATLLFIVVAPALVLYNPPAGDAPFLLKVLGQQKYPPTQLYLLMTLGPLIALIPWADKVKGKLADAVILIGRVPMFYYLIHLFLIHLSAFVVNLILSGNIQHEWYGTAPLVGIPAEQRWSLPVLYLVWIIDVVILYYICQWYARYKANHRDIVWLKYL